MNKELAPPSEVNALAKKLSFQLLRQEKENHPPLPPKKPLLPKKTLSEAQKLKMRQGKEAKKLLKNNLLQRANEMSPETKLAQVKARIVHESKFNENSPVAPLIGPLNIAKRPEYRPPKMTKKQAKKGEMNNSPASQLSLPQALERARVEAIRALALSDIDPLDKIARMTQIMEYDDPSKFYSMVQVQPRGTPLATSNPQKISSALSKVASVIGAEADPNDKTAVIKEIMKDIDKAKERALNPLPINSQLPAPPEKKDFVMDHTAGNAKSYHIYHRKILGYFIYPDMTPAIGYKRSVADLINEIDTRIASSPSFGYSSSVAPASIAWPSSAHPASISDTPVHYKTLHGVKIFRQQVGINRFIYLVDGSTEKLNSSKEAENLARSMSVSKPPEAAPPKEEKSPAKQKTKKPKFQDLPHDPDGDWVDNSRGHDIFARTENGQYYVPSLPDIPPMETVKEVYSAIDRVLNSRPLPEPENDDNDGDVDYGQKSQKQGKKKQSKTAKKEEKKAKKPPDIHEYHTLSDAINSTPTLESPHRSPSPLGPPQSPLLSSHKGEPEIGNPESPERHYRPRPSPSSHQQASVPPMDAENPDTVSQNLADINGWWKGDGVKFTELYKGYSIYHVQGGKDYYVPGLAGKDRGFTSKRKAQEFIDFSIGHPVFPKTEFLAPDLEHVEQAAMERAVSPPVRYDLPYEPSPHERLNLMNKKERLDHYAELLAVPVNEISIIHSFDSILYPNLGYYDVLKLNNGLYSVPEVNFEAMDNLREAKIAIATEFNRRKFMENPKDKRQHKSTPPGEVTSLREVAGGWRSSMKHRKLAHIRKQLSHGGATTAFLEPYFEDGVLKHLNYSGPGNPMTPEYIQAHPPITRVNGQPSWEDSIAFQHDLDYGTAFKERDQEKRKRLVREADLKFIREYEKHRDDPLRLGYDTIKAKISVEDALSKSKPIDALLSHITPYYGRQ